jgi:hypothetical protein
MKMGIVQCWISFNRHLGMVAAIALSLPRHLSAAQTTTTIIITMLVQPEVPASGLTLAL